MCKQEFILSNRANRRLVTTGLLLNKVIQYDKNEVKKVERRKTITTKNPLLV